jgi:integrase
MPRPRPPYVELQVTRHGRKVWYFRRSREGARIRLPDDYGSAEWTAAYNAALAGQPGVQPRKASVGKLKWLVELYMHSAEWKRFGDHTRKTRGHMYGKLVDEHGQEDVEFIDKSVILASVDKRGTQSREVANTWLTAMRNLFTWGVGRNHLEFNPCDGVKGVSKPKKDKDSIDDEEGHKTWTEEDLAQFEKKYPQGTPERLVYAICLYTGFRIGDAARFGRQHIQKDGTIKLRNEKTGAMVYLPVVGPLREAITRGPKRPKDQLGFVVWKRGVAVGKEHLGAEFSAACEAAGLVDCTAHGLRKAAATRLAENGATESQLMAVFGWTRPDMAVKYTKAMNKKRLAMAALGKLFGEESVNAYSLTAVFGKGFGAESEEFSIA